MDVWHLRLKPRSKRSGFTLVEILTALAVGGIVLGAAYMLLGQGLDLTESNSAYSVTQRGAISSFEFLPKDIGYAGEVEIISDAGHKIADNLLENEEWHYIALSGDKVHHIYWDGTQRKDDPIAGSESIKDLRFYADVFSDDIKGGHLVRFHVNAERKALWNVKKVSLDRTLLVRASDGVLGENAAVPSTGVLLAGTFLRYRGANDGTNNDIYGNPKNSEAVDYKKTVTWVSAADYSFNTSMNARLTLPKSIVEKMDPDVPPIFKWIVCAADILLGPNGPAKREDPDSLKVFLTARLGAEFANDMHIGQITPPGAVKGDPFDGSRGLRVLEAYECMEDEDHLNAYTQQHDFKLKPYMSNLTNAIDYKGNYIIVSAHYKEKNNPNWDFYPVYTQLGEYKSDNLFTKIMEELKGKTVLDGEGKPLTWENENKSGIMELFPDANNGRGAFLAKGTPSDTGAMKVLLKLTPEDFEHLNDVKHKGDDEYKGYWDENGNPLYGVTNYSVYVDANLPADGNQMSGGYGILLNGSTVLEKKIGDTVDEYTSSGYLFQFDPGAKGFLVRLNHYSNNNPNNFGTYAHISTHSWGARPMYFYDASKYKSNGTLSAPRAATYFTSALANNIATATENFNSNISNTSNQKLRDDAAVYYRVPFYATTANYYQQLGSTSYFNEKRDNMKLIGFAGDDTYGRYYASPYSPKQMQSWEFDKYPANVGSPGNNDLTKRQGYRWDGSWNVNAAAWAPRHILKLTILEVTRDILGKEVASEWRTKEHHDPTAATWDNNTPIHKAGDMFLRAELIQLKDPTVNPNDSTNYVYSKPLWFGKFKGDSWKGDSRSVYKKTGNSMMHYVAKSEPEGGDAQTFRRRGMRVRSWKESVSGTHPDYDRTASVWTPPVAVDLNAVGPTLYGNVEQTGSLGNDTFGQYDDGQYVTRPRRRTANTGNPPPPYTYAYDGGYSSRVYGRLSLLRRQGSSAPLFGLSVLRGWDYGNSDTGSITDLHTPDVKRFLMITQGLQLPFEPKLLDANFTNQTAAYYRNQKYAKDRDRLFGFRFWTNSGTSSFYFNDTWIGEGFTPYEISMLLGLDSTFNTDSEVTALYTTTP